jgi:hypothetical protein
MPENFGVKENKVINLEEKLVSTKEIKNYGIKLVHQPRKIHRTFVDRLKVHSDKANNLRGSLKNVLRKKI